MRYPTGHRDEARARMVAAAGRGFRRRGFGAIGVDGLAREAAVTSGAFYGHFKSKDEAFHAAVVAGLDDLASTVADLRRDRGATWFETFVDLYLIEKTTCDMGDACTVPTLSPDVARAAAALRIDYTSGMDKVVRTIADGLPGPEAERHDRAQAVMALLVGAAATARASGPGPFADAVVTAARSAALRIADLERL